MAPKFSESPELIAVDLFYEKKGALNFPKQLTVTLVLLLLTNNNHFRHFSISR